MTSNKSTGFVLMPFSGELAWLYTAIRAAAKEAEIDLRRADDIFGAGVVIEQIKEAIKTADVVVAVCTGRNANVFYELGIAEHLHMPVLVAESATDLPFDVQHFRAHLYGGQTPSTSRDTLHERLVRAFWETLGQTVSTGAMAESSPIVVGENRPVQPQSGRIRRRPSRASATSRKAAPIADEYLKALDALRDGDSSEADRLHRRALHDLTAASNAWESSEAPKAIPQQVTNSRVLDSWRPVFGSYLEAVDRPLRTLCAVATAAIERDATALQRRITRDLVDLFEVPPRSGTTWIIYMPQLAAEVAAYMLLARALALHNWPAYGVIAGPKLSRARGDSYPWIVDPRFTHPESLGTNASLVGVLNREFVGTDPVWEQLDIVSDEALTLVADANFVASIVSVAVNAKRQRGDFTYCWGLVDRTEPTVLRELADDESPSMVLASLAGEDPSTFRAQFPERAGHLLSNLRQAHPGGWWSYSDRAEALINRVATLGP